MTRIWSRLYDGLVRDNLIFNADGDLLAGSLDFSALPDIEFGPARGRI